MLHYPLTKTVIMEVSNLFPSSGRMPLLESLPTLLQKPIDKLQRLTCVAGVTTGTQQADLSVSVIIHFSHFIPMDYTKALSCFIDAALSLKSMIIDFRKLYIMIRFTPSKTLLN